MSYKKLGDLVAFISNRNIDGKASVLYGININKFFMPSVANIIGVDLKKYKVVKKYQFACNRMHVGRDERLPISMSTYDYDFIVSPAYDVFHIVSNAVLPDYLMMWFRRREFDRQCWFYTDADVRGGLSLDALKSIEILIPSIEKQQELIAQYQSISNKIKVNEQICGKLEATAQTMYRQWFVDFEFPNEDGEPYKSSGGAMVFDEELEKEIPEGWEVGVLGNIATFSNTRIENKKLSLENYISTENMLQNKKGIEAIKGLPEAKTVTKFENGDILISNIRPYLKKIWYADKIGGCSNDVLCIRCKDERHEYFVLNTLWNDSFFDYIMQGAKGTKMPRGDKDWIMSFSLIIPIEEVLDKYVNCVSTFKKITNSKQLESQKLTELQSLLLSRLATFGEGEITKTAN